MIDFDNPSDEFITANPISTRRWKIDPDKINSIDDVAQILGGLQITFGGSCGWSIIEHNKLEDFVTEIDES